MTAWLPPTSEVDYRALRCDVGAWRHAVEDVLERHDLRAAGAEIVAGYNPTFPTFLVGDVVVKFFGCVPTWRTSHAAERAALTLLLTDPRIRAPRLLATGQLADDVAAPWPYLVLSRVAGNRLGMSGLDVAHRERLAADLGEQLRRVHALKPSPAMAAIAWEPVDLVDALARSSLPPHLIEQAPGFVAGAPSTEPRFLHGDLAAQHVFVERGNLTGLIDWGDAVVMDPHLELIQVLRSALACDTGLFRAFLASYGWERDEAFARKALAQALRRQAIGLAQHLRMDVFEPVAARWDLATVATLDDLADLLFGGTGARRA